MREVGIQQSERVTRVRERVFAAALLIEVVLVLIDKSELTNPYVSYCFRVTFALTLAVLLSGRFFVKEMAVMAAVTLLCVISYFVTGRNELLRAAVFVFALRGLDHVRMLKLMFFATLFGCVLIALLSVTGMFGAMTLTQEYGGRSGGVSTRYCMGFGHPNAMQCMFLMLVLLGLYLYGRKATWYVYALLFAANAGIFLLTDSRTGFAIGTGAIVLYFLAKRLCEKKWFYIAGGAVMLCFIVFSVWAAAASVDTIYRETFAARLDDVLNGRIENLYYGTKAHAGSIGTWSLFSSREARAYFDMGFVRMFYWYGIVPSVCVCLLIPWLSFRFYRMRDAFAVALFVSAAAYTVVEAHLVSVYLGRVFLLPLLAGIFHAAWTGTPPCDKTKEL